MWRTMVVSGTVILSYEPYLGSRQREKIVWSVRIFNRGDNFQLIRQNVHPIVRGDPETSYLDGPSMKPENWVRKALIWSLYTYPTAPKPPTTPRSSSPAKTVPLTAPSPPKTSPSSSPSGGTPSSPFLLLELSNLRF